jgi:PAS domain S-box-containing protein
MGFDLTNTVAIAMGAAAFLTTIMAVFLFVTAPGERLARTLGCVMISSATWSWFAFAYYVTADTGLARQFGLISTMGQIFTNVFVVQYAYVYLSESATRKVNVLERILYWFMMTSFGTLAVMTLSDLVWGTQLIAEQVVGSGAARLATQGAPFARFHVALYVSIAFIFPLIMSRRARLEKGAAKRIGVIISTGTTLAYLLGSTGFLTWFGITGNFTILQGLAMPAFMVVVFYTITNYKLFNARIAVAEVFIFGMWGFLFLRVLLHTSIQSAIPDISILVAVIALGLYLIRNVTQELATKIKLEEVTSELHAANESLESKVQVRTKELDRSKVHIEQVVEHLPVGLIETEASGKIVRINDVAEDLFGIAKAAAIGTMIASYETLAKTLGARLEAGSYDTHITMPHERDLEVAVASVTLEHGEGFIIIIRDVTEKRTLERSRNDFVATAAHQLRTPLAAIKWTFELLVTEQLNDAQKKVIAEGAAGIKEIEHIDEGLMKIARVGEDAVHPLVA